MNKRIDEEILLRTRQKNGPSLSRLLVPGPGRRIAAAVSNEVRLPTAETIEPAKQVGNRRAKAIQEGRSPDLTQEELAALETSVEARKERVSEAMDTMYERIRADAAADRSKVD